MKVWDLGGQIQYRTEWSRYSKTADALVFVVDASAVDIISYSRKELSILLEDR
mgnify:CR=1 FL=1